MGITMEVGLNAENLIGHTCNWAGSAMGTPHPEIVDRVASHCVTAAPRISNPMASHMAAVDFSRGKIDFFLDRPKKVTRPPDLGALCIRRITRRTIIAITTATTTTAATTTEVERIATTRRSFSQFDDDTFATDIFSIATIYGFFSIARIIKFLIEFC
uniref:Uncharacterized protein n=1 Tax=Romanomermis culicivorax TaxID=13658 RepID=A0A915KXB2_ROMCU